MRFTKSSIVAALILIAASCAWAVSTSHWVHDSEADFKGGTLHNVVVTNLGDIKLSRAVQAIGQEDPHVTNVNALAEAPDGTIYAGTGPKGILLAVKSDKVTTAATIDSAVNILSLCFDDKGALLLGTGGEKGTVLKIAKPGDKPVEIFSAPDVQYIWGLIRTPDGNIYAATGPNGQVFEIKPDGTHTEIYKSSEDNITSIISDGKDRLYLGTDPNGLVVRLNRTTHDTFVVYNAVEAEVTALALDANGNLFAATGEVDERQQPPPPGPPTTPPAGRPEDNSNGAPIPPTPAPTPPNPPAPPQPNPGEPKPIPSTQSRAKLSHQPVYLDLIPTTKPSRDDEMPGEGEPNGSVGGAVAGPDQQGNPNNPNNPQNPADQRPPGNAIYKIDKDGFVTEIFRQNVVIYSMITQNNLLLVGTGGDGNVYQVDPDAEETVVLAKVDVKQVMCLLPVHDGRIFMGLANTGGISAMTSGYAGDGNFISPVLDATQVSRFGNIQLHGQLPDGTTLKVATRSGNVKESESPGWSNWSDDLPAKEYIKITAPSARFLQYRLSFASTDSTKTPVVDHVDVAYQIPNLAPEIKSIKIGTDETAEAPPQAGPPNAPAPPPHPADNTPKQAGTGTQTITWDASDPNNDTLVYTLYFRRDHTGDWILLKDKLRDTSYDWDTKTVADGRYQVKVVASDALSNPPGEGKTATRISSFYVVDNTPPVIGDVTTTIAAHDATIQLVAQDATSIIGNVEYTVDSNQDWQSVLPVDNIFDDPRETVKFTVKDLAAGAHQITIRATDSCGNQALTTVSIRID
jgi:hypothetical protein